MAALVLSLLAGQLPAQDGVQSFQWHAADPAQLGLSAPRLEEFKAGLASKSTKALLVAYKDQIVLEWYAEGHSADKTHYTASMAKAIVGGLATAIAINDGQLSLDDPVAKFVAAWRDDPQKAKITIRHLGSHTSGIEDAEADGLPHDQLTGWKGDFWKRLPVPSDPFTIARDKAPLLFEPGEKSAYSNPGIAMLTYATTAAIQSGPHKDIRSLLRNRIMRPIGVEDSEWAVGYGKTFVVDGLPLVGSWGGGNYTARATARVGRLMLREGNWDGKQILSKKAVQAVTADAGTPGSAAIGWWSNNSGQHAKLPKDAFWGRGAGHQILLVVPSHNLIVVRSGGELARSNTADAINKHLFEPLMTALDGP